MLRSFLFRKTTMTFVMMLLGLGLAWGASAIGGEKRAKIIDFEDEVVEGMNKKPLDSLNQISEAVRRKRKPHLYLKRMSFRSEMAETFRTLRFEQ